MSRLIDGAAIAAAVRERTAAEAAGLGERPVLAIVAPTDDAGAAWYARTLERAAGRLGLDSRLLRPAPEAVISTLDGLSADPGVHGILCQTPLPPGLTAAAVGSHIAAGKDVDGANPASLGRLASGDTSAFPPATAAAVLEILRAERVPLAGRRAVVVGRSNVVGKPAALLLLARHATVTICHSRTAELASVTREADVLVAAAGRPRLLGAEHVRPGAVVIDVGTNATEAGVVGDVDTAAVEGIAAAITPVPGGVGPVTTATLLRHVVGAARRAVP